ncbi:ribosome quality control complex subunit TCF25-like [Tubulanus polymorphus]|uniref:ribosome quality control complex subunit TCF25-like n=1 Tax=Tubulanus polymorphus TaxID=672921 RepID=UPI003DA5BAF8
MSNRAFRKLHGDNIAHDTGLQLNNPTLDDSGEDEPKARGLVKKKKKNKQKVLNHEKNDNIIDDDRPGEAGGVAVDSPHSQQLENCNRQKQVEDNTKTNLFDLLNEDEEEDENNEDDGGIIRNEEFHQNDVKIKKKKRKRKKNKNANVESAGCNSISTSKKEDDIDEVEAAIQEVNAILGDKIDDVPLQRQHSTEPQSITSSLLNVEHRNLNPENEMKKIFGSRVVQSAAENNRRRQRNRIHHRSGWLAQPKDTWPPIQNEGLSMNLIEKSNGLMYFTFVHSTSYQQTQFRFLDAVESYDPQNIMDVLKYHPYHIDSLIQLSDTCRMNDDTQMAADLIERALFAFESAFHTLFSLTQGNCRLDFRRPENRAFYIALFRHLKFVGLRGCYRTALDFCKLLLNLDPENDPMCVLLMIDFYALRSQQYTFLIRLFDEWEVHRNLSQLPNFAMSIALAHFYEESQKSDSTELADEMLQNALLMFPSCLLPLLDKCSINPDARVSAHEYFSIHNKQPPGLTHLINLFIDRCWPCWKIPEVVSWLEQNVKEILDRIDQKDPVSSEYASKRNRRYQKTPRNIFRHIIMYDVSTVTATIPSEILNPPIVSYDPLPPLNSIQSYTRPERLRNRLNNANVLSMFLRSMMPNYNPEDPPADLVGAVGGGGDTDNVRQGIGVLMDAMRDLLRNIQPVPPPVENGENAEDQGPINDDIL